MTHAFAARKRRLRQAYSQNNLAAAAGGVPLKSRC